MSRTEFDTIRYRDDATDWRKSAACLGEELGLFFAPKGSPDMAVAKNICAGCGVDAQCLEWALTVPVAEDFGVLGGLDEVQRNRIRRQTA